MTAFALLLAAVYLVLGVLIMIAMRTSEAVFRRLPTWALPVVYLGAGGLLVYTLTLGNVLAYIATIVIVMGFIVYGIVVVLPRAVPFFGDLLRPLKREVHRH